MSEKKKKGQESRLNEIEKIINYFSEGINQNELIGKKDKNICKVVNYTGHLLILASTVTGCVSISAFGYLVDIPVCITSSAATIKFV